MTLHAPQSVEVYSRIQFSLKPSKQINSLYVRVCRIASVQAQTPDRRGLLFSQCDTQFQNDFCAVVPFRCAANQSQLNKSFFLKRGSARRTKSLLRMLRAWNLSCPLKRELLGVVLCLFRIILYRWIGLWPGKKTYPVKLVNIVIDWKLKNLRYPSGRGISFLPVSKNTQEGRCAVRWNSTQKRIMISIF